MFSKIARSMGRQTVLRTSMRCFGADLNQAAKNLSNALSAEIEHEDERLKSEPEVSERNNLFEQSGWKVTQSLASTRIVLTKKVDDTKVSITFDAKANESSEEEGEEGSEDNNEQGFDFSVFINRGKARQLLVDCYGLNGQTEIINVSVLDNAIAEKAFEDRSSIYSKNVYEGPSFETLDEKLQEKIHAYLQSLGIDERLVAEIELKGYEHEGDLYVGWLKNFKELLK